MECANPRPSQRQQIEPVACAPIRIEPIASQVGNARARSLSPVPQFAAPAAPPAGYHWQLVNDAQDRAATPPAPYTYSPPPHATAFAPPARVMQLPTRMVSAPSGHHMRPTMALPYGAMPGTPAVSYGSPPSSVMMKPGPLPIARPILTPPVATMSYGAPQFCLSATAPLLTTRSLGVLDKQDADPMLRTASSLPKDDQKDQTIQQLQSEIAALQAALRDRQPTTEVNLPSQLNIAIIRQHEMTIEQQRIEITTLQQRPQDGDQLMQQLQLQLEDVQRALEVEQHTNQHLRDEIEALKHQVQELPGNAEAAVAPAFAAGRKFSVDHIYRGNMVLKDKVTVIEGRGNIKVDGSTGHVNLLNPIMFVKRSTNDEPVAEFEVPEVASQTCRDLAELSRDFHDPIRIEGHTRGGTTKFWQALADDRARIVAELMVHYGADPDTISTAGLPGTTGLNETRTVVYFDIPGMTNPTELARLTAIAEHQRPAAMERPKRQPLSHRGSARKRPGSVERKRPGSVGGQ